jgi:hypothetical protein
MLVLLIVLILLILALRIDTDPSQHTYRYLPQTEQINVSNKGRVVHCYVDGIYSHTEIEG